jgi:ATP-dependent Clp protease, protease subunit
MSLVPMVIVQDGKGERSYDIYSRLLKERIVFVEGEVTTAMASVVQAQLLHLEAEDQNADIFMYINSPGGSVIDGLAIIDTMNFIKPDVSTIVTGQACSMGSMFLSAGTKGKRIALPNARVMIHSVSSGTRGTVHDQRIQFAESEKLNVILTQMLADNVGRPYDEVYKLMERDHFMSATQSLEFGIVDKIIATRDDLIK